MNQHTACPIICIGAANIDYKYHALGPVILKTSNPVTSITCYGGVARNVSENLARLGNHVRLVSFVGNDLETKALLEHTKKAGVDVSLVQKLPDQVTGTYIAFLDQKGEQVVALADMEIYDAITWKMVEKHFPSFPQNALIFVDTGLPSKLLKSLIQRCDKENRFLAVDLVSVAKAKKVPKNLKGVDLLVGNRDEIASLSGVTIKSSRDYTNACFALLDRGAKYVVMTLGSEGLFYVAPDEQVYFPAREVKVVDVTGVGDTLFAGMLHALAHGLTPFQSIPYGISAALINLVSSDTVSCKMNRKTIEKMVRETNFLDG